MQSMFTVSLFSDASSDMFRVQSVDVKTDSFVHRVSFPSGDTIDDALSPQLAEKVHEILENAPKSPAVFSAPDMVIDITGLILARLRVLTHDVGSGVRHVTLRFKYFVGSLAAAFRRQAYMTVPTLPHREMLAVNVLEGVCLPACDLAALTDVPNLSQNNRSNVQARLAILQERRDEIYFHIELLKRFIESNPPGDEMSLPPIARPAELKSVPIA